MNTVSVEQIVAANKSAVAEAQELASTMLNGFGKLVELNLATTKAAVFDTSADVLATFSAKSPADVLSAQTALVAPLAEKALAYGRSVYSIASETGAELTKVADEKAAAAQKAFNATVDNMAKNAPAGSEAIVAALKSSVAAGQNAVETARASAKKAVEAAEKQATAVAANTLSAVKANARKK